MLNFLKQVADTMNLLLLCISFLLVQFFNVNLSFIDKDGKVITSFKK